MVVSALCLPLKSQCNDIQQNHPAMVLMHLYVDEIKNEKTVNPYIVNIIAINELRHKRHYPEVRNYIEWYLTHLNYPDRYGLTGTIYNYEILMSGSEKSTDDYDSVDGYAGTFLHLLDLYLASTNDKKLINDYWIKIKDIAYLIHYLQKQDGLTVALWQDQVHTKYLMDNCEAYAGIMSFQNLARRIGREGDAIYASTAENIRKSILTMMYNREAENYYWAIDNKIKHVSQWTVLYPDAIAQLFPICFGLLDQDHKKTKMLWRTFNKHHHKDTKNFAFEQRVVYELTREKMNKNFKLRKK